MVIVVCNSNFILCLVCLVLYIEKICFLKYKRREKKIQPQNLKSLQKAKSNEQIN